LQRSLQNGRQAGSTGWRRQNTQTPSSKPLVYTPAPRAARLRLPAFDFHLRLATASTLRGALPRKARYGSCSKSIRETFYPWNVRERPVATEAGVGRAACGGELNSVDPRFAGFGERGQSRARGRHERHALVCSLNYELVSLQWIRSSSQYQIGYLKEILVTQRPLNDNLRSPENRRFGCRLRVGDWLWTFGDIGLCVGAGNLCATFVLSGRGLHATGHRLTRLTLYDTSDFALTSAGFGVFDGS
jgi:hypothetical protein